MYYLKCHPKLLARVEVTRSSQSSSQPTWQYHHVAHVAKKEGAVFFKQVTIDDYIDKSTGSQNPQL